jgi:hypothetical protein
MEAPPTAPPLSHSENWFYNQDGVALGPFSSEFMESEFEKGTFAPYTLLWHPDQTHWQPLIDCHPSWTQPNSGTILRPGPLRIPLPSQNTSQFHTPPALPEATPSSPRAALKPIAHSTTSATPPPPKNGILSRFFGRKS